jgi:hypothetical protein
LSTVDDATLLDKLKLVSTVTENLTCWLPTGKLRKFSSVYEILDYFIQWRLQQYSTRINVLIDMLGNNITSLNEKVRFITFYLNNVSEFKNSSKLELLSLLTENNFSDTMLDMKIWNLTGDKIAELENAVKDLISKKKVLEKTTNINLYIKELETL